MSKSSTGAFALALILGLMGPANLLAQVDQKVKEAVDLYKRGQDGAALAKMKEVLAEDPSSDDVWPIIQDIEYREWAKIMLRKGEHAAVIKAFLNAAAPAARQRAADADAIKALLSQMDGSDWAKSQNALRRLSADHGEYAIPHLVSRLGSDDTMRRARAMEWMRRMGRQAVLPLIQVMSGGPENTRPYAATVLAQIGDRRALPYLLHASMGDGAVASALREFGLSGDARAAFLALAQDYYDRNQEVVDPYRSLYAVWRTMDGNIVSHEVPKDVYHLKLAEEVLFHCLAMNPADEDARVLLASVLLAEAAAGAGDAEGPAAALRQASIMASVENPALLEKVILKALDAGRPAVAAGAVELLGKKLNAETFGAGGALSNALVAPFKRVRIAAALAISHIKPTSSFPNADRVVPVLMEAVSQTATRTILVVDDQVDSRRQLVTELNEKGHTAYGVSRGSLGLARVNEYPIEDMVIIRYDLKDETVSTLIRNLKANERTAEKPIGLLCNASDLEAAKTNYDGKVQVFISTPLVANAYEPEVRGALGELDSARENATLVAAQAAASLATMDPQGAIFSSAQAVSALLGVLNADDRVRIPAMQALGRIGDSTAQAPLLAVFQDAGASEAVRGNAAIALAEIARANDSLPGEVRNAIGAALLGEGGHDYWAMLGRAIGIAPLDAAQRFELLNSLRTRIKVDTVEN